IRCVTRTAGSPRGSRLPKTLYYFFIGFLFLISASIMFSMNFFSVLLNLQNARSSFLSSEYALSLIFLHGSCPSKSMDKGTLMAPEIFDRVSMLGVFLPVSSWLKKFWLKDVCSLSCSWVMLNCLRKKEIFSPSLLFKSSIMPSICTPPAFCTVDVDEVYHDKV